MSQGTSREAMVVAFTAESASEAIVVRGLLESAGIHSPNFDAAEPFPLNEPSEANRGAEIFVRASQADEARRIIEEYTRGNSSEGADKAQSS